VEVILAILQVLGIFVVLPALIGLAIVGSVLSWERFKETRKQPVAGLACRVDADCPPGYVCRNGVCLPASS